MGRRPRFSSFELTRPRTVPDIFIKLTERTSGAIMTTIPRITQKASPLELAIKV